MNFVHQWSNLNKPLTPRQRDEAHHLYESNLASLQNSIKTNQCPELEGSLKILESEVKSTEYQFEGIKFDEEGRTLDPDFLPRQILKAKTFQDFLAYCSTNTIKQCFPKKHGFVGRYITYGDAFMQEAQLLLLFSSPKIIAHVDRVVEKYLRFNRLKAEIDDIRFRLHKQNHFRV